MNYYYILVCYTNPVKIKDYRKSMLSGHVVRASSLKEAQRITEKYGIANPFHSENVKHRNYRRLDMRLKHNKAVIKRRLRGRGGNIWYEENGELKKVNIINIWKCAKCNSDNVKILVWKNLKTNKISSSNIDGYPDGETHQDIWCNNCKKYVNLI